MIAGMWRTAWTVIVRLVEILIVLAMFAVTRSPFETVVVSGLVLIYTAVVGSFAMFGLAINQMSRQNLGRYIALARALRVGVEIESEALAENHKEAEKHTASIWIFTVARSIMALIAVVNLVRVL